MCQVGGGIKGRCEPIPEPSYRVAGVDGSFLIWSGGRHLEECLWLWVLQCMSSVLRTEKDMTRRRALASRVPKSFWRRQMFPQYEREATVRAKSSKYEIIRPQGILKCTGATLSRKRRGEIGEP